MKTAVLHVATWLLFLLGAPALAQKLTTAAADPVPVFENMPAGAGKRFPITIRNTGEVTLRTMEVVYVRPASVVVYGCQGVEVAPGSSCTVDAWFLDHEPGRGSFTLAIPANVPGGAIEVPIAWNLDPYPIATSTPAIVFEQQIGASGEGQTVKITNIGVATYDVSFAVRPDTLCWFDVPPCLERQEKEKASFDIALKCETLAPGQSCDIVVGSAPSTTPRDVVRLNLEIGMGGAWGRIKLAGASLPRQTVPGTVIAIEYVRYYADTVHYFLTVSDEEKGYLDTGRLFGWQRTGEAFWVYPADASIPGTTPVCRYYGLPEAGLDTHFYSASRAECDDVLRKFGNAWIVESEAFFRVTLPHFATGACPPGTSPVYRRFNNLPDVNHVYTTSRGTADYLRLVGWIPEGYGPEAVAMCVPQ